MLRNTFLDRQTQCGGLTESDITFDPLFGKIWEFYVEMNCL